MTEVDLRSVKNAVNTRVCVLVLTNVNISQQVRCGTDDLLYPCVWEMHKKAALGGVGAACCTCRKYTHTNTPKVLISFTNTRAHFRSPKRSKNPIQSHKPNKDKCICFIFQRRIGKVICLASLWARNVYCAGGPLLRKLLGNACQSEARLQPWIDGWLQALKLPVVTEAKGLS